MFDKNRKIYFLNEPDKTYRIFNILNYYIFGGINTNNNEINIFLTIINLLAIISIYVILLILIKKIDIFSECEYKSDNCSDYTFNYN